MSSWRGNCATPAGVFHSGWKAELGGRYEAQADAVVGRPRGGRFTLRRGFRPAGTAGGAGVPVHAEESRTHRARFDPGRAAAELGPQRAGAGGISGCVETPE